MDVLSDEKPAGDDSAAPPRRRRGRVLVRLLLAVVLLAVVLFAGASWYFAGQIRSAALQVAPYDPAPDLRIVGVGSGAVTLVPVGETPTSLASDDVYGLSWPGGFGRLGHLESTRGREVTRDLDVLQGSPPSAGDLASFLRDAYPAASVGSLLGATVSTVDYGSPAGRFAAWYVPGRGTTWAVMVHGRGATRSELLRLMSDTTALGLPSLDLTYRHDPDNGGGLARFGQTEWRDLEAGVRYALDHGATQVVLAGTSMGGAIVASFLQHSSLADHTAAVVLDSAALDFDAVIRHGAAQRRLPVLGTPIPGVLVGAAERVAARRYDLDLDALDYLADPGWLTVPALVLQGTSDDTVPASVATRLARERPDQVQLHLVPGAEHVGSWNEDPDRYDGWVRDFLAPYASAPR